MKLRKVLLILALSTASIGAFATDVSTTQMSVQYNSDGSLRSTVVGLPGGVIKIYNANTKEWTKLRNSTTWNSVDKMSVQYNQDGSLKSIVAVFANGSVQFYEATTGEWKEL